MARIALPVGKTDCQPVCSLDEWLKQLLVRRGLVGVRLPDGRMIKIGDITEAVWEAAVFTATVRCGELGEPLDRSIQVTLDSATGKLSIIVSQ